MNNEDGKAQDSETSIRFVCPITMMEFNGILPFVVVWTTGFVLSEKALKEMGIERLQDEYGPFTAEDIVRLLPAEDEVPRQVELMESRRMKLKKDKKLKKRTLVSENDSNSRVSTLENYEAIESKSETEPPSSLKKKIRHQSPALSQTVNDKNSVQSHATNDNSNSKGLSVISSVVKNATHSISKREEVSSVFKSMFHKGKDGDLKDRDLFMSVAGLRYTIT